MPRTMEAVARREVGAEEADLTAAGRAVAGSHVLGAADVCAAGESAENAEVFRTDGAVGRGAEPPDSRRVTISISSGSMPGRSGLLPAGNGGRFSFCIRSPNLLLP